MPRRHADDPRPAASVPAHPRSDDNGAVRSYAAHIPAKGKRDVGGVLRNLSRVSVADMVRLQADSAQRRALEAARADGQTEEQARKAGASARATAIKDGAAKAGVSPVTARRWARGTQKNSPKVEKDARRRVQRSMGGARGVRARQIEATRRVDVGKVKVSVKSGSVGSSDERRIGAVNLDPEAMAEVARLVEQGKDAEASQRFQEAVLSGYGGKDLADYMTIEEMPDSTSWL